MKFVSNTDIRKYINPAYLGHSRCSLYPTQISGSILTLLTWDTLGVACIQHRYQEGLEGSLLGPGSLDQDAPGKGRDR